MRTRGADERRAALVELGVADPIVAIALGDPCPKVFDSLYSLRGGLDDAVWEVVKGHRSLRDPVLLWSDGLAAVMVDRSRELLERRYVEVEYEERPPAGLYELGGSNQSMMAHIIAEVRWVGDVDFDSEELEDIARFLVFEFLREQRQKFTHVPKSDPDYCAWRLALRD